LPQLPFGILASSPKLSVTSFGKAWTDEVGAEWEKLYTAALQKKFLWVKSETEKWEQVSQHY